VVVAKPALNQGVQQAEFGRQTWASCRTCTNALIFTFVKLSVHRGLLQPITWPSLSEYIIHYIILTIHHHHTKVFNIKYQEPNKLFNICQVLHCEQCLLVRRLGLRTFSFRVTTAISIIDRTVFDTYSTRGLANSLAHLVGQPSGSESLPERRLAARLCMCNQFRPSRFTTS